MASKSAQLTALVADPSSHMAALVAVMLRSIGIRSVEATVDLPRTAAELARQAYGLILIDEQLGGRAGFEMIRKLRQIGTHPNRETPIIMMAAAPDAKMIAAARDAGVSEFLRKPFSAEHIKLRLDVTEQGPAAVRRGRDLRRPRSAPPHRPGCRRPSHRRQVVHHHLSRGRRFHPCHGVDLAPADACDLPAFAHCLEWRPDFGAPLRRIAAARTERAAGGRIDWRRNLTRSAHRCCVVAPAWGRRSAPP